MATLGDLTALPELGLRTVVPGPDRPVRWVATSELADPSPYLEGGELLLSTGLVEHRWPEYVDRLAHVGVAGLGWGTGAALSHLTVPDGLVAAAERARLALVEVPEPTPFIAVSKALSVLLDRERQASTQRALDLQQELTRAAIGRSGAPGVLRTLARAADGEVFLVDREGRAVGPAGKRVPPAVRDAVATIRPGRRRATVTETGVDGTVVVQPVDDLFLVMTSPRPLDDVLRAGLATAAALLTLDADRARAARDAELRLRDRATRLLLRESVQAAADVGQLIQGVPALPGLLRVLQVREAGAVRAQLAQARPEVLTTEVRDGTFTAVCAADAGAELAEVLEGLGCRVGVGPEVVPARAARGHTAARAALEATDAARPVVCWEDRFRGVVRAGLSDDAAEAVATGLLGGVAEDPALLATLRSYLGHLGHWQPAADELGVHRNTLRKRIARIERLTGRELDTAAARADLWIALTIVDERPG